MEKLIAAKLAHIIGAGAGVALMFAVIRPRSASEGFSRAVAGTVSVWIFTNPVVLNLLEIKFFQTAGIINTTIMISTMMMFCGWFAWAMLGRSMERYSDLTIGDVVDLIRGRK